MKRIQELRSMTRAEVERIHRVHEAVGTDGEKAVEAIADLRAYCGRAWPSMLRDALRRYERSRRGDNEESEPAA